MSVKTIDSIPPGTRFEHTGSVEVLGNVGAGATVLIKEGGLRVKGDVEDGAQIETEGGASISISSNRKGTVISGGSISGMIITSGKVIMNGVDVTNSFNNQTSVSTGNQDLIIDGVTGNGVTLKSSQNIEMNEAGDNLKAKADHNLTVGDVGHTAKLKAGHNLTAGDAGAHSKLDSGHSMSVGNIGEHSKLGAGHELTAGYIGQESSVESGHRATIQGVDRGCEVEAGHALTVREAYKTAELDAGHKKTVSRLVDTLSFTFAAKAPVKTTTQAASAPSAVDLSQALSELPTPQKLQLRPPPKK